MINFIELNNITQLQEITNQSYNKLQIIFKHSTTCGVSSVSLNRFNNSENPVDADYYLLDIRKHRDVSSAVAETFKVKHESPQVLVIKDGECIYNESHFGIDMEEIAAAATK